MEQGVALLLVNKMLLVAALVVAPVLISSLLVGLGISFIQVITQIQEMTLTFVPKMIVAAVVILAAGAWMLDTLVEFTRQVFQYAATVNAQ